MIFLTANPEGVSAFLAIISIIVTIIIALSQMKYKRITYDIISNNSLISAKSNLNGELKIHHNGMDMNNASIIEIMIIADGNEAILVTDIIEELEICLEGETGIALTVLSTQITEVYPKTKTDRVTINVVNNHIKINKFLINPKDYFIMTIITNEKVKNIDMIGRIVGVRKFNKIQLSPKLPIYLICGFTTFVFIFVYGAIFSSYTNEKGFLRPEDVIFPIILFFIINSVWILFLGIESSNIIQWLNKTFPR